MLRTIRNILSRASIWPRKQPEPDLVVAAQEELIQKLRREIIVLEDELVSSTKTIQELRDALGKKPDVVFSFSQESFNTFQKQFEPGVLTNATTPHGAGYLLGIQRVLSVLRDNHVSR